MTDALVPDPAPADDGPRPRPAYLGPPAPPRDAFERTLVELWESEIGVAPLGIDDDFFDAGGDSFAALAIFEAASLRLGIEANPSLLIEAPTIRKLAALRPGDRPAATIKGTTLVPLQPEGARAPLYFLHAIGGEVLHIRPFAAKFAPDRPVVGIRFDLALEELAARPLTMERLAARYIEAVRAHRPDGPYHLCGFSLGGTIAFEMARQLAAAGAAVGLLGILDSSAPDAAGKVTRGKRVLRSMVFGGPRYAWRRAKGVATSIVYRSGINLFGYSRKNPFVTLKVKRAVFLQPHAVALRGASRRYRPDAYRGEVLLMVSRLKSRQLQAADNGWGRFLAGPVELVSFEGRHDELMHRPECFARLHAALDRVEAR